MTSNKYDTIIRKWATYFEIPFHLVKAIVRWESSFIEWVVSRCGAVGLMQLMPFHYKPAGIDPLDPDSNIKVGCAYLKKLWGIFEDEKGIERWKFALGAYNAGMHYIFNAQKLAKAAGAKNYKWYHVSMFLNRAKFWQRKCDWKQTTEYVDRIMERYYNYEIEHASKANEKST